MTQQTPTPESQQTVLLTTNQQSKRTYWLVSPHDWLRIAWHQPNWFERLLIKLAGWRIEK